MIRRAHRLRRKRFTSPLLLGLGDYFNAEAAYNPYVTGSPHFALYLIGFTHARDSRANPRVIEFAVLQDFADSALRALGHTVDPPGTLEDA